MSRRTRIAVIATIAVYFGAIAFVPVLDKLVLFPSSHPVDAGKAVRRTIAHGDGELEIWTARSSAAVAATRPESYVLRFYGNADRAERWVAAEADMFPDRAVEVWGVNYPGFGGSTGPARLTRIGPAILAAFDALRAEAAGRPIIVSGTSFGTIAALHLAAERDAAGVVLHNPPALREMIVRGHGWWNLWLLAGPLSRKVPAALDSVANARAAEERAVFLLAENDEIVAPRFQELVVNAYGGEKRLIRLRGAGHLTPLDPESLASLRAGLDWLVPADASIAAAMNRAVK